MRPYWVTRWDHASLFEVVTNPSILLAFGRVTRVCPKIYGVLRVKRPVVDNNDSFAVNISAAFTSQMRDDAIKLSRWIVNKLCSWSCSGRFLARVVAVVIGARLFGVGLEDETAANLSPNAGAQLRLLTPRALDSNSMRQTIRIRVVHNRFSTWRPSLEHEYEHYSSFSEVTSGFIPSQTRTPFYRFRSQVI